MKNISIVIAVKKEDKKVRVYNKLNQFTETNEPVTTFREIGEFVGLAVEQVEKHLKEGDEIISISHSIFEHPWS